MSHLVGLEQQFPHMSGRDSRLCTWQQQFIIHPVYARHGGQRLLAANGGSEPCRIYQGLASEVHCIGISRGTSFEHTHTRTMQAHLTCLAHLPILEFQTVNERILSKYIRIAAATSHGGIQHPAYE